ncbi:GGDEF domain-containing protein [Aromatoleum petrolei]|uniref:Diguanylate cyclase n=1 Tax=Aromatoleum petrolei TaxID=76116 RepID=A0ABX1MMF1_9RHOO|nr:GGDEF domain-containing protein [Aromatoleum petrolei]NMF87525.1 diguanylate cyclase [Aromatoleum petrolei]QTQ38622.1 Diguanylate cyclase/phosphodiesterase, PAS domain-containing [Aromatoleum petrolei]
MFSTAHGDHLPSLVDLLLDAVFLVDSDGRIAYVSAACERMLGYTPQEMIGRELLEFLVPEDRERTVAEAGEVVAGRSRIGFENRYIHKDGRHVHLMWSARWSERERLRIGVARDVSELKHAEAIQRATYAISEAAHEAEDLDVLLREIHRIIATLVPLAGLALATCDRRTGQLAFSYQRDCHGNPLPLHEPVACDFCSKVICGGRPVYLRDGALGALSGDDEAWFAIPLIAQHETIGALVLQGDSGKDYTEKDRELLHYVAEQVAIAIDRAQLKAELLRAARYDELTGLPNRRFFNDRIKAVVARSMRNQARMALLYIDLDDFKQVNDSLGHASGDQLLQEVARRIQRCVRGTDTVARLGGDEFVVLLDDLHTPDDARGVADKIREAVSHPVDLGSCVLRTQASIGIAVYPDHGQEIDRILQYADMAMYEDKRNKTLQAM